MLLLKVCVKLVHQIIVIKIIIWTLIKSKIKYKILILVIKLRNIMNTIIIRNYYLLYKQVLLLLIIAYNRNPIST